MVGLIGAVAAKSVVEAHSQGQGLARVTAAEGLEVKQETVILVHVVSATCIIHVLYLVEVFATTFGSYANFFLHA